MLRRIILALIGLLAVVNGSKWLFDGKRLPTLVIDEEYTLPFFAVRAFKRDPAVFTCSYN